MGHLETRSPLRGRQRRRVLPVLGRVDGVAERVGRRAGFGCALTLIARPPRYVDRGEDGAGQRQADQPRRAAGRPAAAPLVDGRVDGQPLGGLLEAAFELAPSPLRPAAHALAPDFHDFDRELLARLLRQVFGCVDVQLRHRDQLLSRGRPRLLTRRPDADASLLGSRSRSIARLGLCSSSGQGESTQFSANGGGMEFVLWPIAVILVIARNLRTLAERDRLGRPAHRRGPVDRARRRERHFVTERGLAPVSSPKEIPMPRAIAAITTATTESRVARNTSATIRSRLRRSNSSIRSAMVTRSVTLGLVLLLGVANACSTEQSVAHRVATRRARPRSRSLGRPAAMRASAG